MELLTGEGAPGRRRDIKARLMNAMAGACQHEFDLDIGVVYTHEREYMTPLVPSLAQSGEGLAMRLILVDNLSNDGAEQWQGPFEHLRVIRNQRRLGYGPNLNRILAESSARYLLLMNTDMVLNPAEQCLAKMVQFMDDHPDCGVSTCRVYHPSGTYGYPARRFLTLKTISARRLGCERLFSRNLQDFLYQDRDRHSSFPCDWVSGCFMFFRRQAIDAVGGFDCGFRKYFEDVDISARIAQQGWQVMFNGGTYCYHHEQRASLRVFSLDGWRHLRSYWRWLRKWGLHGQLLPRSAASSGTHCR